MGSGTITPNNSLSSSSTATLQPLRVEKPAIVLQSWLKKLKTMKKKYFVLYRDTGDSVARLEYYDSDKKFKSRSQPKRKILLGTTTVERRLDTKHKFVIAFHTKLDCFGIVLDSETELNTWLRACVAIQKGEEIEDDPPKPTFGKCFLFIIIIFNNLHVLTLVEQKYIYILLIWIIQFMNFRSTLFI